MPCCTYKYNEDISDSAIPAVQSLLFPTKEKFDWRLFDDKIHLTDKGERLGIAAEGVDSAARNARIRQYVWMATAVFLC